MAKSRVVRVGLIQLNASEDPARNLEKTTERIYQAAKEGAQIVGLQELFRTQYFAQTEDDANFDLAEPIPGPTTNHLSRVAKDAGIYLVGGSVFEKANDRGKDAYFNTSLVFGPDGLPLGKYRKTHIPYDECYYEKFYFNGGNLEYEPIDTEFGKIGVLICYDQWFPEPVRILALKGAELLFKPTAIGTLDEVVQWEGNWQDAWETVQRGNAIANSVYLAAVNRVGKEGRMKFWGGSFISGPFGEIVAHSGDEEQTILADCDLDKVGKIREAWRFFANRRPELYGSLTERV